MNRDTWSEVSLSNIRNNMLKIRQALPKNVKLMAVVKANGYGHGDIEAAQMAQQAGAEELAVAYLDEALHLRTNGITLPILILTPIHPRSVKLAIEHDLMLTVTSAAWFSEMREYKPPYATKKLRVHVKLDTGLGRIGIQEKPQWEELVPWLKAADVVVEGIYTHFATAGREDTSFLKQQYKRFVDMMEWAKESRLAVNSYHCAGSAAALRFPELAMDMVRIGAAMYGFYPKKLVPTIELEPALSLHSTLMQVKKLYKGEYLGYDNAYQAEEDQWVGTVPIGYADGWSQSMQGTELLVGGRRAKVVGKICMDQLMVRLPGPCEEGSVVTLIGRQGSEEITFAELAAHINSVPQEISTSLTARVTRKYNDKGEAQKRWDKRIIQSSSKGAII
ncbi:alanine racemase [Bacillus sp. FJAT-26390]|uniref:alanine racemase n=1 Tax=Bacillus sp. FJAT-26390 TaxID=1743142 RepID=UPI000807FA68|nr:alanine racemase [Bacillus sp. FJAT-26390]OBZ17326.1 alanine racemase [Bacillus sp. FJAT-26390]